jgi:hypothetical protein
VAGKLAAEQPCNLEAWRSGDLAIRRSSNPVNPALKVIA